MNFFLDSTPCPPSSQQKFNRASLTVGNPRWDQALLSLNYFICEDFRRSCWFDMFMVLGYQASNCLQFLLYFQALFLAMFNVLHLNGCILVVVKMLQHFVAKVYVYLYCSTRRC